MVVKSFQAYPPQCNHNTLHSYRLRAKRLPLMRNYKRSRLCTVNFGGRKPGVFATHSVTLSSLLTRTAILVLASSTSDSLNPLSISGTWRTLYLVVMLLIKSTMKHVFNPSNKNAQRCLQYVPVRSLEMDGRDQCEKLRISDFLYML